jgi:tRNA (cmo5U34)-methyltransferase
MKEWDFADVAPTFDDYVRSQLPWYEDATQVCAHFVRYFLPQEGLMYDLGTSNGNIGRSCASAISHRNASLIAIDSSIDMTNRYRGPGEAITGDIAEYDYKEFDVAVAFLSLSFLSPVARGPLLTRLQKLMRPGGAIIVFDKFEQPAGEIGQAMRTLTTQGKREQGVEAGEVLDKELSLAGVMRPLRHLNGVKIWQRGEFAGYVITTPPSF